MVVAMGTTIKDTTISRHYQYEGGLVQLHERNRKYWAPPKQGEWKKQKEFPSPGLNMA